jgi:basic amino acid/polyamine antiporter, APA family
MMLSVGSIFILRKKTAQLDKTGIYKMKWYPLQPVLFIATYAFIAVTLLINETKTSLTGLVVLTGFILLYFLLRRRVPSQQKQ